MDNETLSYAVNEIKTDVKTLNGKVDKLMMFMAVSKADDKKESKNTAIKISAAISIGVAAGGILLEYLLK